MIAEFHHAAPRRVRRLRHRDDRLRHAQPALPPRDFVEAAQDVHTVELPADLCAVIVEHADDAPLGAAREVLDQVDGRFLRAQDQHGLAFSDQEAGHHAFLPRAVGHPASPHDQQEQDGRHDEHAARHGDLQHEHQRRHRRGCYADRHQDAPEIGQARITPHSAVEPETPEQNRVHQYYPGQCAHRLLHVVIGQLGREAQPVRAQPGGCAGQRRGQRRARRAS